MRRSPRGRCSGIEALRAERHVGPRTKRLHFGSRVPIKQGRTVRHTRHYTVDQALASRVWIAERVRRVRSARRTLEELGPCLGAGIRVLDPMSGGSYPSREVAGPLIQLSLAVADLESVEVVLRDIDSGLVEFPSMREGCEIYLCWRVEEDEIRFWHPVDSTYSARQPL